MEILYIILLTIISYLVGSIPSAYLRVKALTGKDVRKHGTGNIGTMNTHRTTGKKSVTFFVLLSDAGKGMAVYGLAYLLNNYAQLPISWVVLLSIVGVAVILGHNYSIFMKKFAGGKGLATGAGFFLLLNPYFVLIRVVVFFVTVAISKYMVLGQIIATILLPVGAYFIGMHGYLPEFVLGSTYFLPALVISIPIFIKHAPRLKDVWSGKEPKLYYKEKDEQDENGNLVEK